jgi:hypothetical protein
MVWVRWISSHDLVYSDSFCHQIMCSFAFRATSEAFSLSFDCDISFLFRKNLRFLTLSSSERQKREDAGN